MTSGDVERVRIDNLVDVQRARRILRSFATRWGMSAVAVEELVLAASEMSSNLVKYSKSGGELIFGVRADGDGSLMLEVQAQDSGPGIGDLEHAVEDGYSTGSTLGSGLPAVRRLADSFIIQSGPDGTKITITKRLSHS